MPLDGATYVADTDTETTRWLTEGRDTLIRRGWCQGSAYGSNGSVCMLAAMPVWGRSSFGTSTTQDAIMKAIIDLGYEAGDPASFNDTPGRTFDEVLAVYDKAIELSRRSSHD